MIWLEEYHINKYVKKYDARTEGRYLNPPTMRAEFDVGDRVVIIPQGRYKFGVNKKIVGRIADIVSFHEPTHKVSGRHCRLKYLDGSEVPQYVKEINLKLYRKLLTTEEK